MGGGVWGDKAEEKKPKKQTNKQTKGTERGSGKELTWFPGLNPCSPTRCVKSVKGKSDGRIDRYVTGQIE